MQLCDLRLIVVEQCASVYKVLEIRQVESVSFLLDHYSELPQLKKGVLYCEEKALFL